MTVLDTVVAETESATETTKPIFETSPSFQWENETQSALKIWFSKNPHPRQDKLSAKACILEQIARIDQLINDQLNTILHAPEFQALEARWRGLWALIDQARPYKTIKIRILDISWSEICKDIDKAADFDQSFLFQRIYNEEFDMPGGQPYGVLIGGLLCLS